MRKVSETRDLITNATQELLNEEKDLKSITVRAIAHRANVSVGLIHYYFQKRSNLLNFAITIRIAKMANMMRGNQVIDEEMPAHRIRSMLKSLYTFVLKHDGVGQLLLIHWIDSSDMDAVLYLIPWLKEDFDSQKDEVSLRIIALQILLPMQAVSINPRAFHHLTGIELHNVLQREDFIDILVDNLLNDRENQDETERSK